MNLCRRFIVFGLCLLLALSLMPQPTRATDDNPYQIKQHSPSEQRALFIISPDKTSSETEQSSRRFLDIFGQVAGSYWKLDITTVDAKDYEAGQAEEFDVIVVSDEFGEPFEANLENDLLNLDDQKVVYFGLGGNRLIESISSTQTAASTELSEVAQVNYKGVSLSGVGNLRPLYEVQSFADGDILQAPITDTSSGEPLAVQIENDNAGYLFFPFVVPRYYDPQSYTTAMLDVLHESFGEMPNYPKQALLRLEDVNAYTYSAPDSKMSKVYKVLKQKDIPFHIALIERYIDPAKNIDSSTADHRYFNFLLQEMVGRGDAVVVQHGYTHQYQDSVSAIGFEFWNEKQDKPAAGDNPDYARQRIEAVQAAMAANDLPMPDIWETPHYALGENANQILNETYPMRYENVHRLGAFPFPVKIDGTVYIPENLGFIEQDWQSELPAFKKRLTQLETFRNATPSFFWHPWRDQHEVDALTSILQEEGYTFKHAYDLVNNTSAGSGAAAYQRFRENYTSDEDYVLINAGIISLYGVLLAGAGTYARDRFRFRKYQRLTSEFDKSIKELRQFSKKHKRSLPTFTIFVPARNEGLVIANTIENLIRLDYPKNRYQIVIITDERELDDNTAPLTKIEVARKVRSLNKRIPKHIIKLIEVPRWYSGVYQDFSLSDEKSTKGRALNFALQTYAPPKNWKQVDYIGVLDADGRLDPNVLKEAAWERIENDSQILQGPVYQVSNLANVSPIGVMAGLELARHHLVTMMPRLLKNGGLQFIAGTNYFIDKKLLEEIGGWDQHALVEDAELAVRLYTQKGVSAAALTLPEIEQTPATFKIYRRQRERWARGHFELLGTIVRSSLSDLDKFIFIRTILLSQFRFIFDIAIPLVALAFLLLGYFSEVFNILEVISLVLLITAVFMWDVNGQTYRRLATYSNAPDSRWFHFKLSAKLFVLMPVFIIVQAIPRIDALLGLVRREAVVWKKTERTVEQTVSNQEGEA